MSVVLLVLMLLLIAVNGFFVATEFAIVRSRRTRLEQMRDEGVRSAALALDMIDHVDEYVATSQVGITLASLGIGFLGEPALAELIEPLFGGFASRRARAGDLDRPRLHDRHLPARDPRRAVAEDAGDRPGRAGAAADRAAAAASSAPPCTR